MAGGLNDHHHTPLALARPRVPRRPRQLGRRRFLTLTAAAAALAFTVDLPATGTAAAATRVLPDLYDHGTETLDDYRLRYALYRSDPDLRAAHAAHPFVVTWDDHETDNNYAGSIPEDGTPPADFLLRRATAYRAYWENQPLRAPQLPVGPDARLYRRLRWGLLAQFDVLDTRQYRSDQAYGDGKHVPGPESEDPARTMTGAAQERWLIDGWRASRALWNVVPQQSPT